MIGDVIGKPGRKAVAALLPALRRELALDFVIANGENAAAGRGLTEATAQALFDAGVDALTSGNHIWDQKEIFAALDQDRPILRPLNYPPGAPGRGATGRPGRRGCPWPEAPRRGGRRRRHRPPGHRLPGCR